MQGSTNPRTEFYTLLINAPVTRSLERRLPSLTHCAAHENRIWSLELMLEKDLPYGYQCAILTAAAVQAIRSLETQERKVSSGSSPIMCFVTARW